jgi:hypothetical protein
MLVGGILFFIISRKALFFSYLGLRGLRKIGMSRLGNSEVVEIV